MTHPPYYQCMVLPKGFAGEGALRVTLAVAPSPEIPVTFNLPEEVAGWDEITLCLASDDHPAPLVIATASLGDEHRAVLDPALWRSLMQGVGAPAAEARLRAARARPPSTPAGAAWRTSRTLSVLQALNAPLPDAAPAAVSMARRVSEGRVISPVRQGPQVSLRPSASVRSDVRMAAMRAIERDPLASAMSHVDQLFGAPGDPMDVLVDRMIDVDVAPEDADWQRLLSAYVPSAGLAPHALLRATGLRPNQATVEWLRNRVRAASGGSAPSRPFGDAVLDQLLFTAPHIPDRSAGRQALVTQQADDDSSIVNRLAALASEFALHPLLGMAVDLVFRCTITASELRTHLARNARLSVELGRLAVQPWTLVTPEAWPKPRGCSVFRPAADGWCHVQEATLSNQDMRGGIAKWTSALLRARNNSSKALFGSRTAVQELAVPGMQTGPLVMHLDGLSDQSQAVVDNQLLPGGREDVLNLEDLVVGVRPVLELVDLGRRRFRRALLDRTIDYEQPEVAARQALARGLEGLPQARDEGHIPVMRLSEPGEKTNQPSRLVGTDQVFEWSGWNPAVPFPGAEATPRCERLKKTIRARASDNLPYRYGLDMRAACRWVLRDGSSRVDATAAERADDAPWVGDSPTGKGFTLRRQEPLRPPLALRRDDGLDTPLLQDETATHVVLASWLDGHEVLAKSVRFILPGAIRDLIDLERHGVFDRGLAPTATAYAGFERASDAQATDIFPSIDRFGHREPVLRRRSTAASIGKHQLYHPDPLVRSLRLMLVRAAKDVGGQAASWYPVHDADGQPVALDVPLYEQRAWPDACAVKLTFEARPRGDTQPVFRLEGESDGVRSVRLGVQAGEQFTLMVLPTGDRRTLKDRHQFGGQADDDPRLANVLTIDVRHLLQRPEAPELASVVAAPRAAGGRVAALTIDARVDVGSTTQVDLHAGWTDPVDDPDRGPPKDESASGQVASSMVVALLGRQIDAKADARIDDVDFNQPVRPAIELDGQVTHELPDTRHRRVAYSLTAAGSTLLAERSLQAPGDATSTDSERRWVSILASLPPLPPRVREMQLAFRFDRTKMLALGTSKRTCALSILMERSWWNSGPGELLAVAIAPMPGPDGKSTVQSAWAADPIRRSLKPFGPFLGADDFVPTPQTRTAKSAEGRFVLFEPSFEAASDAWRVDVELRIDDALMQPFVQLVLARFQPNAIAGASESQLVVADFFQLPSNRSATVSFDPESSTMHVAVAGPVDEAAVSPAELAARERAGTGRMRAVVQRAESAGLGAKVWVDTSCEDELKPESGATLRRQVAHIHVPPHERRGEVRVAIFERTAFQTAPGQPLASGPLHYFDIVPMELIDTSLLTPHA